MKTKVSIAGLGWWGKVMINRLSSSSRVKIVNLIDPYPDEDAVKLADNKNLKIFTNFDDAFNEQTIDAIILCTPNSFHMVQTIKVANLGVHVFCEKPLSLISSEVKKMIDMCNKNKVCLLYTSPSPRD